jgi:hypothetical protein
MINVKFEVRGVEEVKSKLIKVKKESFEKWKQQITQRMEEMSEQINMEYGSLGEGSLSEATFVTVLPNAIQLHTDNMVVIYLEWGTQAHGPKTAQFLHFFIDGVEIFTKWVQGVQPHEIIQRATDRFKQDLERWYQG